MRPALIGCIGIVMASLAYAQQPPSPLSAGQGPQPAVYPIAWQFEFEYVDLRRITVLAHGRQDDYWYLLYTVKNPTATTIDFQPSFQLVTEDLQVIDADLGVSALVFDAIRERHKRTHPYLIHPTQAVGPLKVGADYARESVAVWRVRHIPNGRFTVYIGGLSGETRLLPNPSYRPDEPETRQITGHLNVPKTVASNPRFFAIRKTLAIEYVLPGPTMGMPRVEPVREAMAWIMR